MFASVMARIRSTAPFGFSQVNVIVAHRSGDDQFQSWQPCQDLSRHPAKLVTHAQHVRIKGGRHNVVRSAERGVNAKLAPLKLDLLAVLEHKVDEGDF